MYGYEDEYLAYVECLDEIKLHNDIHTIHKDLISKLPKLDNNIIIIYDEKDTQGKWEISENGGKLTRITNDNIILTSHFTYYTVKTEAKSYFMMNGQKFFLKYDRNKNKFMISDINNSYVTYDNWCYKELI